MLVVDEFQDLLNIGSHLAALFKSLADRAYADDFRQAVNVRSPGALRNALFALEQQNLIAVQDEQYRVSSPFFAAWLRSRP